MNRTDLDRLDRELQSFLGAMFDGMGRLERRRAMAWYVTGLLLDGERKSIEPMAARLVDAPNETEAMRQRLQQCVSVSDWDNEAILCRLAQHIEDKLPQVEAFVIDDTGFPKKGTYSVGVQRQYSGTLGRRDNCQIATSLHLAGEAGSACIGMRLYLPESWAGDPKRRRLAGVPAETRFQTKWQLALDLIDQARRWGVQRQVVLADAGYGDIPEFRDGLTGRGLRFVVGVQGTQLVWPPGSNPQPPQRPAGRGGLHPTKYVDGDKRPIHLEAVFAGIPRRDYKKVSWRSGSRGRQSSRFLAHRVRLATDHHYGKPPSDELWLIAEWRKGEDKPRYALATLPPDTPLEELVRLLKLRWRVERDYQELKAEVGLDHFEGRTWRGFHHHVTLCAVAHAFLALRRALSPPAPPALDPTRGAKAAPARTAQNARHVSAMPPTRRTMDCAAWTVTDVIG